MIRKKGDPNKGGPLQMSFFMPESEWTPPDMSELPEWKDAKRISIDSETFDPQLTTLGPGAMRDGRTVGWSFKIETHNRAFYLPYGHEGGDNLPKDQVMAYLRRQVKNFEGEYVGANLQYDINYGYSDGFEWNPNATFRDIQIADPLIYELHMSYSLKEIGKRNGFDAKDEGLLYEAARAHGLDPKKGLWRLPARFVGAYAERDADSPLQIYAKQREILDRDNLWQVFDVESKLTPVLVRMHRRGVRIDEERLAKIELWAERESLEASRRIRSETGLSLGPDEVWKPERVAPVLKSIGIRLGTTSTGAPQIDKAILKSADHKVASDILRMRKLDKIRSTFAASIRRYMHNGRIHCTFNQIAREDEAGDQKGVRYGRLSAVHPNLQQQPSPERDPEIAGEWRKIFVPEEGAIWGVNDYSQQEPRWTTHFAAVMNFDRAAEAAKRYRDNPDTDNHEMMTRLIHGDSNVDGWMATEPKVYKYHRGNSKIIYLGVCYGEGGVKLCDDLGLDTRWAYIDGWGPNKMTEFRLTQHEVMIIKAQRQSGYYKEVAGEEGQEILDQFDREAPFIRQLANACSSQASKKGFVKTILGRRLHFEARDDGTYDYTHKALNRVIQGSSADQTKMALIEVDRQGYFLQLQVHDETDGSYGSEEEARAVGKIMRECVLDILNPLVPFKVDTECGPSWGEV